MKKRQNNQVQRQTNDRFFKFLIGTALNKENALELYNYLNGTDYKDLDNLQFNTIDDVLYMGMQNDVSFIFHDSLNMYEQQSTYNPNMPLRGLIYTALLMHQFVKTHNINWYSSKLKKIPVPKCIVFYNGSKEEPDVKELRLSDAFIGADKEKACVEFVVKMYNINYGHNKKLLDACKALKEYSYLVNAVQRNLKVLPKEEAIDRAVKECIDQNILRDVLIKFRSEVIGMLMQEYDEVQTMKNFHDEGFEEGLEKGKAEGKKEGWDAAVEKIIKNKMKNGLTREEATAEAMSILGDIDN